MSNLLDTILDEQKFPYENMSLDERNSYLNILCHCKDICDSKYEVNGEKQCQLVDMSLNKKEQQISLNGTMTIGKLEKRCIDGYIFLEPSRIIVDMHITRLSPNVELPEYTVLDEFKIKDGNLVRNSFYNHDMKMVSVEIDDALTKGMIK